VLKRRTGNWKVEEGQKLHNEKFHNLYFVTDIRMIKLIRMWWTHSMHGIGLKIHKKFRLKLGNTKIT